MYLQPVKELESNPLQELDSLLLEPPLGHHSSLKQDRVCKELCYIETTGLLGCLLLIPMQTQHYEPGYC